MYLFVYARKFPHDKSKRIRAKISKFGTRNISAHYSCLKMIFGPSKSKVEVTWLENGGGLCITLHRCMSIVKTAVVQLATSGNLFSRLIPATTFAGSSQFKVVSQAVCF